MMMLALTNDVSEAVVRDLLKHLKLKNVNLKTLQSTVHPLYTAIIVQISIMLVNLSYLQEVQQLSPLISAEQLPSLIL